MSSNLNKNNVQVCDDFIDLSCFQKKPTEKLEPAVDHRVVSTSSPPQKRLRSSNNNDQWSFAFPDWGDDVNLLYVACTRAKIHLCIPPKVWQVIKHFDGAVAALETIRQGAALFALTLPGPPKSNVPLLRLSAPDVASFVNDLVQPFRDELQAPTGKRLWNILMADDDDHDDGDVDNEEDEAEEKVDLLGSGPNTFITSSPGNP